MQLWISLIGLVLFGLGSTLKAAAERSVEIAIGTVLAFVIIVPFVMYGLSCVKTGGCTIYAWFLAVITVLGGVVTLLKALFPELDAPPRQKNRLQE
jgi:cytochrome bd-type quinol oxidase subunit 2